MPKWRFQPRIVTWTTDAEYHVMDGHAILAECSPFDEAVGIRNLLEDLTAGLGDSAPTSQELKAARQLHNRLEYIIKAASEKKPREAVLHPEGSEIVELELCESHRLFLKPGALLLRGDPRLSAVCRVRRACRAR